MDLSAKPREFKENLRRIRVVALREEKGIFSKTFIVRHTVSSWDLRRLSNSPPARADTRLHQ